MNARRARSVVAAPASTGVSGGARLLVVCAASIALSAVPELRPSIGGLSVHPYLAIVALALPVIVSRLGSVDQLIMGTLMPFTVVIVTSTIPEGFSAQETLKIGGAAATALAAMTLVRTERDFTAAVVALALALILISARGMWLRNDMDAALAGINAMRGTGNKNAFSLYALPTLLLIGWVYTRERTSTPQKLVMVVAAVAMVVVTFASANRSGWLGVILVGFLLLIGRVNARSLLLCGAGGIAVYLLMTRGEGAAELVQQRVAQTNASESDQIRTELVAAGFRIGLDNPLLGVSPQRLPSRLARALNLDIPGIETHNAYAYVIGGSGVIAFALLLATLAAFAVTRLRYGRVPGHVLAGSMVFLWLFRGMFTHEILFSPTFALGLGLAAARVQIEQRARASTRASARVGADARMRG